MTDKEAEKKLRRILSDSSWNPDWYAEAIGHALRAIEDRAALIEAVWPTDRYALCGVADTARRHTKGDE